ncbi:hypothetical protein O5D80_002158 [Batrachochytrium dendrobatidis]|nr:hypothetical protein O5D80_002158 [Batrachochytrium dendrobatidis]
MLSAGSLSQGSGPVNKLFKRKTNKAKKGINALVLASGAMSATAFPSFFSFLPFQTVDVTKVTPVSMHTAAPHPKLPSKPNIRRVASLSAIPLQTRPVSTRPSKSQSAVINGTLKHLDDDEDFEAFVAECDEFAKITDATKGLYVAPAAEALEAVLHSSVLDSPVCMPVELQSNSGNNGFQSIARRVQSTPGAIDARHRPLALQIPHTGESTEYESHCAAARKKSISKISTSFFHASIQARAQAKLDREREMQVPSSRSQPPPLLESWDDDFEQSGGVESDHEDGYEEFWDNEMLVVPQHINQHQMRLQRDRFTIRDFALHVQDLRLIYQEVADAVKQGAKKNPMMFAQHTQKFQKVLDIAQVILDIAEHVDESTNDPSNTPPVTPLASTFPSTTYSHAQREITPRHIEVLIDLIAKGVPMEVVDSDGKKISTGVIVGVDERAALECVNKLVRDQVLAFESSLIGVLNARMVPLKTCLKMYEKLVC